jgi:hypothetical protein
VSQPRKPNAGPIVVDTPAVENNRGIDIDSLEVEILIICKNPAAFQQSASYLSRRGWPTTVVGNLGKAIEMVVKNSPDFVMLSCNHPNPGAHRLPALLGTMNIHVIGFAEMGDASSAAKLATMNFKNKLQGLPSGPNIQRVIRKLLREIYAPEETAGDDESLPNSTAASQSALEKAQEILKTKNKKPKQNEDEESIEMGNYKISVKKERKRLKDIRAAESGAPSGGQKFNADEKKALMALADERARGESSMMFLPTKGEEDLDSDAGAGRNFGHRHEGGQDIGSSTVSGAAGGDDPFSILQEGPQAQGEYSAVQEGAAQGKEYYAKQESLKGKEYQVRQEGLKGKDFSVVQGGVEGKDFSVSQTGPEEAYKRIQPLSVDNGGESGNKILELFGQSIEEALERSCVSGEEAVRSLNTVEVVGTLPIESPQLHGYIVMSIAFAPADVHMEVLKSFREKLNKILAKAGIQAQADEGFAITLERFEFLAWVKAEARLAFVTDHQGAQIAVSFVPTDEPVPRARESDKQDMAKIGVDQIDTERPVPFKAYLHLKRNDRLYLYLRNGRKLYEEQKKRLKSNQVKDFYIKAIDITNFKTYSAANFISRTARKFRPPRAG